MKIKNDKDLTEAPTDLLWGQKRIFNLHSHQQSIFLLTFVQCYHLPLP